MKMIVDIKNKKKLKQIHKTSESFYTFPFCKGQCANDSVSWQMDHITSVS